MTATAGAQVWPQHHARVELRAATEDDCERVWRWACAPEVRALSRDPRPVPFDEHTRWFAARLAARTPTWIVEEDGTPVGVLRVDGSPQRVSIALAPEARGRGVGRRAIAAITAAWCGPLVAEVARTNAPSRACFEACGFVLAHEDADFLTYHWSP